MDAALGHLKESVTFTMRGEPGDLPLARFALAKALPTAGRDAARARELAERARDDFRKLPALGKELAAVELWLEEPSRVAPVVAISTERAVPVPAISTESAASAASTPIESAASEP